MSWWRSLGSSTSDPTEFWSRSSGLSCCQVGLFASALSVSQTPPPETPAQSRQWFLVQSGSATSAVTRLAVTLVAPENDVTPGWTPYVFGP